MFSSNQENRVTIIIWKGYISSEISGSMISFGHVALKTYIGGLNNQGIYRSFWPGECARWHRDKPHLCQKSTAHYHTETMDSLVMQTVPIRLDIYSLNVEKINQFFEDMPSDREIYSLFGSLLPRRFQTIKTEGHTCASLVAAALQTANIDMILAKNQNVLMFLLASIEILISSMMLRALNFNKLSGINTYYLIFILSEIGIALQGLYRSNIPFAMPSIVIIAMICNEILAKILGNSFYFNPTMEIFYRTSGLLKMTYPSYTIIFDSLATSAVTLGLLATVLHASTHTTHALLRQAKVTPHDIKKLVELCQKTEFQLQIANNTNKNYFYNHRFLFFSFGIMMGITFGIFLLKRPLDNSVKTALDAMKKIDISKIDYFTDISVQIAKIFPNK